MKSSKYALCALLVASFFLSAGALRAAEPGIYMLFVWGTSDPGVRDGVEISKRKIEAAFVEDNSPYASVAKREKLTNTAGGLVALNPRIREKRTLEGASASGENILKNCRELAAAAGPNDAVMVYILCHGAAIKGPDGKRRHGLAPIATDPNNMQLNRYGIARGTIMREITSKPHRLDMLITDSCSSSAKFELRDDGEQNGGAGPTNPYLYEFLLNARGYVNVNSSRPETNLSPAEQAKGFAPAHWSSVPADEVEREKYEKFAGTVFTNAFLRVAETEEFTEDDFELENFFKKLRKALDDQYAMTKQFLNDTNQADAFADFNRQATQTLVRFNNDSEAFPPDLQFKSRHEGGSSSGNAADRGI
ncbi:MAG: caspase family protein [Thermoguttaceae bacterium]|nr:caspase family protein [Thermoguttaceae bacterium]